MLHKQRLAINYVEHVFLIPRSHVRVMRITFPSWRDCTLIWCVGLCLCCPNRLFGILFHVLRLRHIDRLTGIAQKFILKEPVAWAKYISGRSATLVPDKPFQHSETKRTSLLTKRPPLDGRAGFHSTVGKVTQIHEQLPVLLHLFRRVTLISIPRGKK